MWEFFTELLKYLFAKEMIGPALIPALLGAVVTAAALFYLLLRKEKNIKDLHDCIDTSMAENNLTVKQLVTLVEVLVYGRNRDGIN